MKKQNLNPNPDQSLTQMQALKKHLLRGKRITPIQALNKYGCFRLGARIYDLRHEPHNLQIDKKLILIKKSGKRVAQYKLVKTCALE